MKILISKGKNSKSESFIILHIPAAYMGKFNFAGLEKICMDLINPQESLSKINLPEVKNG